MLTTAAAAALAACSYPAGEPGADRRPDGEGPAWEKPGATAEQYRDDIDACLAAARAQVARDARIEGDAGAGLELSRPGLRELRERMSAFERERRLQRLIRDCMRAKGYTPR